MPPVKFTIPELCVKVPEVIEKFAPTIMVPEGAVNDPEVIEKLPPNVSGL